MSENLPLPARARARARAAYTPRPPGVRARTRHAAAPAPEPSWRAAGAGIELQSFSGPRDPAAGAARAQAVDDAAETLRRLELARPRLSLARIYPLPDPAVLWRPCRTGSFMIRTAAQLRTLCPGPRGRRARRRGGAPPRRRRAGCPRLPRDKRTTVAGCCWAARGARTPRARRSRRRSCRPSSGGALGMDGLSPAARPGGGLGVAPVAGYTQYDGGAGGGAVRRAQIGAAVTATVVPAPVGATGGWQGHAR